MHDCPRKRVRFKVDDPIRRFCTPRSHEQLDLLSCPDPPVNHTRADFMSSDTKPKSRLTGFSFERILLEEPEKCRLTLLGSFPGSFSGSDDPSPDRLPAIIRLEKTAFPLHAVNNLFPDASNPKASTFLDDLRCMEHTDIYMWLAGWFGTASMENRPQGDVKVNIVCPATEVHIRKYSKQRSILVTETPDLYRQIVLPFIQAFPAERTRWVDEILEGRKEQSKILFTSPEFILLPDMKWDLHTLGSLYLLAIIRDASIRSIRDLRVQHIPLLRSIRKEVYLTVKEKWGLDAGSLRMYIHYQPSYYHFHVHIVHAEYEAGMGMSVGQAHLLDDVLSMLDLDEQDPSPRGGIFERMTLTYGLGEQHGLFLAMSSAQD
ncbi:unnamed protein product [Mycena citricolor]|uniref:Scavenger mRNA decapping enzyme n=1 Tax=Mycena citricolor TaxID=2018698 RepID=A0AAD2HFL1_9AGAR|nr:unnamed protein product [Mycena citricolor]